MKTKLLLLLGVVLVLSGCSSITVDTPQNNTKDASTVIFSQTLVGTIRRMENAEAICYILDNDYGGGLSCKRK